MVAPKRWFWSVILSLCLAIVVTASARAELVNVAILHTNDTRGRLESFYYRSSRPLGGLAKRAIFFQEKRRHEKLHWLTLDAGNLFGYTPISYYFQGFADVRLSNWLGYDAAGLGPMDFIFGRETLAARIGEAEYPFISTNVLDSATGKYLGEPFKIITFGEFRIALMGLTDPATPSMLPSELTSGLAFRDPMTVVDEWIPQLKGQSDALLVLTTMPLEKSIALADKHPEIAVIISGGQGAALSVPLKVGPTLIVEAGNWGLSVGLLKLTFEGDRTSGYHVRYFDEQLVPMDGKWVENTKFTGELSTFHTRLDEKLGVVLGKLTTDMPATKVNAYETKLGDFFTDALRKFSGADVAVLDAGSFRDGLSSGAVTRGDLYRAYPSDALVMTGTVDGESLRKILSQGAGFVGREGFLQVSGVSFGLYGANAYDVKVKGEDLDPAREYKIAVTDRMLQGMGGLTSMFLVKDPEPMGVLVREAVEKLLAEKGEFGNEVEGRISYYAEPPVIEAPEEAAEPAPQPSEEVTPSEGEVVEEAPEAPEEPAVPEEGAGAAEEAPAGEAAAEEPTESAEPANAEAPPGEMEVIVEEETDTGLAPPVEEPESEELPPAEEEQVAETGAKLVAETSQTIEGLDYSLRVEQKEADGEIFFSLSLTLNNDSDSFKVFDFPTGQHYDFRVYEDGKLLWNWAYNRYFVQAKSSIRLDPGESKTFIVHWDGMTNKKVPLKRGLYRFSALVKSVPEREVSLVALFEPPLV